MNAYEQGVHDALACLFGLTTRLDAQAVSQLLSRAGAHRQYHLLEVLASSLLDPGTTLPANTELRLLLSLLHSRLTLAIGCDGPTAARSLPRLVPGPSSLDDIARLLIGLVGRAPPPSHCLFVAPPSTGARCCAVGSPSPYRDGCLGCAHRRVVLRLAIDTDMQRVLSPLREAAMLHAMWAAAPEVAAARKSSSSPLPQLPPTAGNGVALRAFAAYLSRFAATASALFGTDAHSNGESSSAHAAVGPRQQHQTATTGRAALEAAAADTERDAAGRRPVARCACETDVTAVAVTRSRTAAAAAAPVSARVSESPYVPATPWFELPFAAAAAVDVGEGAALSARPAGSCECRSCAALGLHAGGSGRDASAARTSLTRPARPTCTVADVRYAASARAAVQRLLSLVTHAADFITAPTQLGALDAVRPLLVSICERGVDGGGDGSALPTLEGETVVLREAEAREARRVAAVAAARRGPPSGQRRGDSGAAADGAVTSYSEDEDDDDGCAELDDCAEAKGGSVSDAGEAPAVAARRRRVAATLGAVASTGAAGARTLGTHFDADAGAQPLHRALLLVPAAALAASALPGMASQLQDNSSQGAGDAFDASVLLAPVLARMRAKWYSAVLKEVVRLVGADGMGGDVADRGGDGRSSAADGTRGVTQPALESDWRLPAERMPDDDDATATARLWSVLRSNAPPTHLHAYRARVWALVQLLERGTFDSSSTSAGEEPLVVFADTTQLPVPPLPPPPPQRRATGGKAAPHDTAAARAPLGAGANATGVAAAAAADWAPAVADSAQVDALQLRHLEDDASLLAGVADVLTAASGGGGGGGDGSGKAEAGTPSSTRALRGRASLNANRQGKRVSDAAALSPEATVTAVSAANSRIAPNGDADNSLTAQPAPVSSPTAASQSAGRRLSAPLRLGLGLGGGRLWGGSADRSSASAALRDSPLGQGLPGRGVGASQSSADAGNDGDAAAVPSSTNPGFAFERRKAAKMKSTTQVQAVISARTAAPDAAPNAAPTPASPEAPNVRQRKRRRESSASAGTERDSAVGAAAVHDESDRRPSRSRAQGKAPRSSNAADDDASGAAPSAGAAEAAKQARVKGGWNLQARSPALSDALMERSSDDEITDVEAGATGVPGAARSRKSAGSKQGAPKRRIITRWTSEEQCAILMGVAQCGVGNWAGILKKFSQLFSAGRTSVDVKDKYRLLVNNKTAQSAAIALGHSGNSALDDLASRVGQQLLIQWRASKVLPDISGVGWWTILKLPVIRPP